MIYTEMTLKAMKIAYEVHKDQVDKGGIPYIFHPIHVAEQMDSEGAIIVALLHDVVEDSEWTIEGLEQQGFPNDVISALKLLIHNKEIDYLDYIWKIALSSNPYAKKVKLVDLKHISDLSRLGVVDEKTLSRSEKYSKAI
jgi:(p)ppGpp synthase/HD superfamily hydrolase